MRAVPIDDERREMFGLALVDLAWACGLVVIAGLAIAALLSIARRPGSGAENRALWTVVVVILPVVGPAMWFATRRRGVDVAAARSDDGGD